MSLYYAKFSRSQAEGLAVLKSELEQKEKSLLSESPSRTPERTSAQPSNAATPVVQSPDSAQGAARTAPGVPLSEFARTNIIVADVFTRGFSGEKVRSFRVVNPRWFGGFTNANYLSKISDVQNYSNPQFETYSGPWTLGFVLVSELSPTHLYRPLTPSLRYALISELRQFARATPLPGTSITILTCCGLVNCDAFVSEIVEICREAGYSVRVEEMREEPLFIHFAGPLRSSIVQLSIGVGPGAQSAVDLARVFRTVVNPKSEYLMANLHQSPETLAIIIAGFPTFDSDGTVSSGSL
jgi:hypothetical protein